MTIWRSPNSSGDSTKELFSQYLIGKHITTVVHLGDTFDRRKYTNYNTLKLAKEMFFTPIYERGIELHTLLGNHDCYFKSTNDVNSMSLTCGEYPIHLYKDTPEVINFDGLRCI